MRETPEAANLLLLHAQLTTENAVLLLDRSGTILWCNAVAARVFGYAAADLTGMRLERLFTPENVPSICAT